MSENTSEPEVVLSTSVAVDLFAAGFCDSIAG